jgi:hypothetical protein
VESYIAVQRTGVLRVLVLVLLLAIAAIAAGACSVLWGTGRGFSDVERFHRARGITTGWARDAVTRPVIAAPREAEREPAARERADQDA